MTIGTTIGIGSIAVLRPVITLFARVYRTVATSWGNKATADTAVGQGSVMCTLFTLLTKQALDNTVSTHTDFKFAATATAVVVSAITVITLFADFQQSVATKAG